MDFTLKKSSKSNEVTLNKDMVKQIINILDKVDCTCVWSAKDNQYIKVSDVPAELVNELDFKLRLS